MLRAPFSERFTHFEKGCRGSGRGYAGFLSIIVDTLAAFVAWICCERLRVVTCGLRENFRNSYRLSTGGRLRQKPCNARTERGMAEKPSTCMAEEGCRTICGSDRTRPPYRLTIAANPPYRKVWHWHGRASVLPEQRPQGGHR